MPLIEYQEIDRRFVEQNFINPLPLSAVAQK